MRDRDDWRQAIDPRLVAACERHRPRPRPEPPTWQRPLATHLDPGDWRTGFLAVREREIPMALQEDLHRLSPQALLRDLHRPVFEGQVASRQLVEGTAPPRSGDLLDEVRRARARAPLPRIESAGLAVRAYQAFRRQLHTERWRPLLADDAPRRPVAI